MPHETETLTMTLVQRSWACQERNGFCLWQKRLEKARFKWPRKHDSTVITLTGQQLNWLLDGYDVMRMKPHKTLYYRSVL